MAPRRKRQSLAEDFLDDLSELFSMLPWWVVPPAVVASYTGVYALAGRSEFFRSGRVTYALIIAGLIGLAGVVGQVNKRRRRDLRRSGKSIEGIRKLSWRRFEDLVAEAFRQDGYSVETTAAGADGGVDLVLRKGRETVFVQCKSWRQKQVGVERVRELFGVVAAEGADAGIVVATGSFTRAAKQFADGRRIRLIEGRQLHSMIAQAEARLPPSPSPGFTAPTPLDAEKPECPVCSSPMVVRLAQRGSSAGRRFWGCTRYPSCRGSRPIE